jgi:hypothetical protein
MPTEREKVKIPLRWVIGEQSYWIKRWIQNKSRSALYTVMPRWLVREAFMYAQRYIKDNEVIPEVEFMTVFGRVCDNELAERYKNETR